MWKTVFSHTRAYSAVTWCYTETLAVAVYMSVLDNFFNSSIGSGQILLISPTQQKEHPLKPTISCFSRYITRIWPTWFHWPIYNSQKPLVVPSQNWKAARSLLFPRPKSVNSTLTFLKAICDILRSCQEKWVIPWNSFGIPFRSKLFPKLSFRWFQPLFTDFCCRFEKNDNFFTSWSSHTYKHQAMRTLWVLEDLSPRWKIKLLWNYPPYIELFWFKSLWKKKSTGITKNVLFLRKNKKQKRCWKSRNLHLGEASYQHQSAQVSSPQTLRWTHLVTTRMEPTQQHKTSNLFANWKLCQQCFIHFFWKKCKLILIRLDNLLLSREHLCKDYLLVPKRLTCFKQKKR